MHLGGIHHLTAVTARAADNYAFYTRTLGLRLVKKTVNQDDVSAYHLFFADGLASPGSDLTFFDWPVPAERRGTNSIACTGLRVASEASLGWWRDRFARAGVTQRAIVDRMIAIRQEYQKLKAELENIERSGMSATLNVISAHKSAR